MKKLLLSIGILSGTVVLTGCGVTNTTYTPTYTSTYRVAYPVNTVRTVRTYPVNTVGYSYNIYRANYYPVNYWNTGYYYPYRYGTRVYYGGSRMYNSWWGF
ncbi:Uncharacterised protein (plasmid) [Legionella adelaidensis]|uniref:Lipoprotein n=1 Tax=Legionella adelaidensis TaxID=45056 RepID=A0A0W0R1E0_9GAMM|nr:hypothetical protein [Legionella adelaidensis]KTC64887.1 hypothetical protein Lade_2181 [Legionella adelaidensis]VEH82942.1 Uncharacterised protein [Legionella adelaidensis]